MNTKSQLNETKLISQLYQNDINRYYRYAPYLNGRVDIIGKMQKGRLFMPPYEETKPLKNESWRDEAIGKYLSYNTLQSAYFSKENIEVVQKLLKYNVYIQSDKRYIIKEQDYNQLKIVMKSIYLQYSQNMDTDIARQVNILNSYVLDYCVPNILSNIEQYIVYKNDVSRIQIPLDLPICTSVAGTRTHPNFIY